MRTTIAVLLTAVILSSVGCASLNPFRKSVPSSPPSKRESGDVYAPKTRPYTVFGKTYYPLQSAAGYNEVGLASWYGKDFHGNKTANGEIYDMYGVSAAHKLLPMGTRVRVTNLENGRVLDMTINDRGPFVGERIIDLSYGAARKLGTVEAGVVQVRVEAIGSTPARRLATTTAKPYHVRVGAFAVRANAERVHRDLVAEGYRSATINQVVRNGLTLYVVQAGTFPNRDIAEGVLRKLKSDFPDSYIIS